MPRSYIPDNDPVSFEIVGKDSIRLTRSIEPGTHVEKELVIRLDSEGSRVSVLHKLTNRGMWTVEMSPWGLTVVKGGGQTIVPNEPFIAHGEKFLPARQISLWHFTNLADPRWVFGKWYTRLRTDEALAYPQKAGFGNRQGWMGYLREDLFFVKTFPYVEGASYPDFGCNCETFTSGAFMEVESRLLAALAPGQSTVHIENWQLFKDVAAGSTEEELRAAIEPLVRSANEQRVKQTS